jgi:hypothetical protein
MFFADTDGFEELYRAQTTASMEPDAKTWLCRAMATTADMQDVALLVGREAGC